MFAFMQLNTNSSSSPLSTPTSITLLVLTLFRRLRPPRSGCPLLSQSIWLPPSVPPSQVTPPPYYEIGGAVKYSGGGGLQGEGLQERVRGVLTCLPPLAFPQLFFFPSAFSRSFEIELRFHYQWAQGLGYIGKEFGEYDFRGRDRTETLAFRRRT
jgi:hypothetical protein